VVASISTTISTIPTATATVAFILPGLSPTNTKVTGGGATFPQCTSVTNSSGGTLQYQENFATAFKIRGAPSAPGATSNNRPECSRHGLQHRIGLHDPDCYKRRRRRRYYVRCWLRGLRNQAKGGI
jgi:hypothetical protein